MPTDDDARAGIGLTLRDVTHERDLNRVKDEIISVVNHELRTPLASVVGFAELLLAREFSEEQRRRFLTSMVQEGMRLAALVDELLDLQRLDGGGEPFTFEACAPRALLERSAASAGPMPPARSSSRRRQTCRRSAPTPTGCSRCCPTCSAMPGSTRRTAARSC